MVLDLGDTIDGKYGLVATLGSGGMGTVYLVRHLLLDKQMALKTFRTVNLAPLAWQRFQLEAKAIAKLDHANIVQVFDFGVWQDNVPYYTMERLSGRPLSKWLGANGRLPVADVLAIFTAVAEALAHAHSQGVVHRDIKPGNIFLDYDDNKMSVKVVDFGLAKLAGAGESQFLTEAGLACGSPLYMSPEQATTSGADWRSDIYSFGCTMFEALTGYPPFMGECALDTIQMHQKMPAPNLLDVCSELGYRPSLEKFMSRLLAKDVNERYQSFNEIIVELNNLTKAHEIKPAVVSSANTASSSARSTKILALVAALALIIVAVCASKIHAHSPRSIKSVHSGQSPQRGAAKEITYFSTINAAGEKQFAFGPNNNIGYISWNGQKAVPMAGTVTVPAQASCKLHIGDGLGQHPELLARFRPNDFNAVVCPGYTHWDPRMLDLITTHLTDISDLDLEGCDIGKEGVDQINRLDRLVRLNLSETNLTGWDLVRLKRLGRLQYLDISHVTDVSCVLALLQGNSSISDLYARGCELSSEDLKAIGKMRALTALNLSSNKLTAADIEQLNNLKGLQGLSIPACDLDPTCIKFLARFKNISCLRVDIADWSEVDKRHLQLALSHDCKLLDTPYRDGKRACLDLRKFAE